MKIHRTLPTPDDSVSKVVVRDWACPQESRPLLFSSISPPSRLFNVKNCSFFMSYCSLCLYFWSLSLSLPLSFSFILLLFLFCFCFVLHYTLKCFVPFEDWWWVFPCLRGFWENVWAFIPCLRFFFFFFEVEISLRTLIPLFMPGSVHSGSASWDKLWPNIHWQLHVSSFPDRFLL